MHSNQPFNPNSPQPNTQPHSGHSCSGNAPAYAGASETGSHYYPQGSCEYSANPTALTPTAAPASRVGSWFEFSHSGYLKGFLIGAGATLVLTNPSVQRALVKGTVKVWSVLQGGVEEVKEQFRDVKAEMSEEK